MRAFIYAVLASGLFLGCKSGSPGSTGAAGAAALVNTVAEAPDAHCAFGGTEVTVGLDLNGNGALDPSEVTQTSYLCNGSAGAAGKSALIATQVLATNDSHCPLGGVAIDYGIDTNGNNVLDPSEITGTSYVCNSSAGGAGVSALISTQPLAADNSNCPAGGTEVSYGLDTNNNGVLDPSEITGTSYLCNLASIPATVCPSSGGCPFTSIASAITAALPGDIITVGAGTYHEQGIEIFKSVQIVGAGPGVSIVQAGGSGVATDRVFHVPAGVSATLEGLTIEGGQAPANQPGGGIYNQGTLTVLRCAITGNTAGAGTNGTATGGVPTVGAGGGGIASTGSLTVEYSSITQNQAGKGGDYGNSGSNGEGVFGGGGNGGGILISGGSLMMSGSTLAGNLGGTGGCVVCPGDCPSGGGGNGGGLAGISATVKLLNDTISGNTGGTPGVGCAGSPSGAGYPSLGGGIYLRASTASIVFNTIDNNAAGFTGAGIFGIGTISVFGSDVSGNTAGASATASDCDGAATSQGYNLVQVPGACSFTATGDVTGVAPGLAALANNGGPTETRLPIPPAASQASLIDQIPSASCNDPSTGIPITSDQRALPRPGGSACDIGAVEVQP